MMRTKKSLLLTLFVLLGITVTFAQTRITGVVIDDITGETLPFVTVVVKGTLTGTVTSEQGTFSLTVPSIESVLQFSFMGYETLELQANEKMTVKMKSSTVALEGAVITGYQTISRERNAGAYNVVSGQNIAQKATLRGNLIESLEGLTTGLSVNYSEGEDKFLIRGTNSVNATRQPLYVVDGVPMSAENVELMVNQNDIQSVSVLRDATAASIWGAQAANGVVVITTKRGHDTDRKFKVVYDGSTTFKGMPDYGYYNYMSSKQFIRTAEEIFAPEEYPYTNLKSSTDGLNTYMFPVILPHELPMYQLYNGQIDQNEYDRRMAELSGLNNRSQIEDYLMQREFFTKNSLSFTSGSPNYSVYGSFLHEYNQGVSLTNTHKYALNLRQDFKVTPWMDFDLTTNLAQTNSNNGLLPEYTFPDNLLPYMMLRDAQGNNLSHAALRYEEEYRRNAERRSNLNLDYIPLDELKAGFNKASSLNARVNAGLKLKLMDGLNFEGRYQYQRNSGQSELFWNQNSYSKRFVVAQFTTVAGGTPKYNIPIFGGKYNNVTFFENNWTVRNQMTFDHAFDDRTHQIIALAGTEVRANHRIAKTTNLKTYNPQALVYSPYDEETLRSGLGTVVLPSPGAAGRLLDNMFSATDIETRFVSFYANAAYTYLSKYSINGSVRVDQSNLFGSDPSVQFKPIWSTGLIWNVNQEDFMKEMSVIDMLNFRLSCGLGGNSPDPGMGGAYDIIYGGRYAPFQNSGYLIYSPASNKITWEKTRTFNVGFDVAVLKHRINASLDIYDKKTTDLLGYRSLDPTIGWAYVLGNLGELTNKGFELSVNTKNLHAKDFSWQTTFALTYNKNKVVDVYDETVLTALNKIYQRYLSGYAAGSIFAYEWAGLDQMGDPQVYDYQNGSKVKVKQSTQLKSMDATVYMGSAQPPWYGGLTNVFTYKNFELSFMFVYNLGHKMRKRDNEFFNGRLGENIPKGFENRWKNPGDEQHTDIPGYLPKESSRRYLNFYYYADMNVVSASYIKLRDLSLSYTLPKTICDKASLGAVKVRLQTGNLFYWAANKDGIDPEAYSYSTGTRFTRFGPSFSAGLTVNFK